MAISLLSDGWTSMTYTGDPQFFKNVILAETLSSWAEMEYEMKEGCQTPNILLMLQRLIKLVIHKHMLPFMKKEGRLRWWHGKPRELNPKSQRFIPRPWDLTEFTWLDFTIAWEQWLFFFLLFSRVLNRNIYNCYLISVSSSYFRNR